jgi:tetratricopeptide (TPR) repeat protein
LSARVFRIEPDGTVRVLPDNAGSRKRLNHRLVLLKEQDIELIDETEATPLNDDDAIFYYNRGNAWFDKGEYDQAIKDFDEAIEFDPTNACAYYNRGIAW